MIHATKISLAVCLLAFTCLLQAGEEKPFAEILAIKGVKKVEHLDPYLIIALAKDQQFRATVDKIKLVVSRNTDPDLRAIDGKYKLKYYNVSKFNAHKKEYSNIHNSTTVSDLQRLFKDSAFTTVYELDWSTDTVAGDPKHYAQGKKINSRRSYEKDKQVALGFIERLRETKFRPEKILCINTAHHGPLAYPVIDGKIKINRKSISWSDFAAILDKKELTP